LSHFTKLAKANITSADAFIKACRELGLNDITKSTRIADYAGRAIDVDVAAAVGSKYHVAIQKNGKGTYDMVSDWWGVRGAGHPAFKSCRTDQDIADKMLKHTTKHTIIDTYQKKGFRATVTDGEDESVVVKLRRY
jgi:hypothetical protein